MIPQLLNLQIMHITIFSYANIMLMTFYIFSSSNSNLRTNKICNTLEKQSPPSCLLDCMWINLCCGGLLWPWTGSTFMSGQGKDQEVAQMEMEWEVQESTGKIQGKQMKETHLRNSEYLSNRSVEIEIVLLWYIKFRSYRCNCLILKGIMPFLTGRRI